MNLEERIANDIALAMRAGEAERVSTLRLVRSALHDAVINARQPLTEEQVLEVIGRQAKQRRDSIEAYAKGRREDLAAAERRELAIILAYLPEPLTEPEIEAAAQRCITEVGAAGLPDLGRVMAALKPEVKGRADGKTVSDVVRRLLGG